MPSELSLYFSACKLRTEKIDEEVLIKDPNPFGWIILLSVIMANLEEVSRSAVI